MKDIKYQQIYCSKETEKNSQSFFSGPRQFIARNRFELFIGIIYLLSILITPSVSSAHEVYVLNQQQINTAINTPSFNMWKELVENFGEFTFWAFIGILLVVGVFLISTLRFIERKLDPFLLHMRRYATVIARVTIGLSFIAAGYYHALFGPELPIASNFGAFADLVTITLTIIGFMIVVGFYARLAAFIGLLMYISVASIHGSYLFTYTNYLGELIVILLLGAHSFSVDSYRKDRKFVTKIVHSSGVVFRGIREYLVPRSFAILRILFGVSLMYASLYAKFLHNNLALLTVEQYHLDKLLGFEPHFLVLGAFIVEMLIGTFFILGIEIRFTSLFLLFWLTLSLIFFGEVVWPHLILIGIPIAYIFYGYDDYSLEGYFFKKKKYKPVL